MRRLFLLPAAALAAVLIYAALQPEPDPGIPTIQLGAIIPLTGDLSSVGEDMLVASRLAVSDFNSYLENRNAQWRLGIIIEDSGTRPVTALEKLSDLRARGIGLVLGPLSSAEIKHAKGYADSNGMVLVSCCSNAPSLAIPGDSIFRMNQDHTHLGPALARLIMHGGSDVLVPVWRGDTWGDGLREHVAASFEDMGGMVDEGVRYAPDAPDFSAAVSILAERVRYHGDAAVLFMGFDEAALFFQTASDYDVLAGARWYGTNANAGRSKMLDDPIASEFAHTVRYTALRIAPGDGPEFERVRDHALDVLGRTPPEHVYAAYDAVWVLGLAVEDVGSDPGDVRLAMHEAASKYVGALGDIKLNEAGDLTGVGYEVIAVRDGGWAVIGTHEEGGPILLHAGS